jgi:hypothetical protein
MSDASTHIAAWEAAGLLDTETADRLRASKVDVAEDAGPAAEPARPARSTGATMFGPAVTVAEFFGYLGGAFLVAAWSAFMGRTAGSNPDPEVVLGIMAVPAAVAFTWLGLLLRRRGERGSRAAGVAFLLTTSYAAGAVGAFASAADIGWPVIGIVTAGIALAIATILRVIHPSVLTEIGVLAWYTTLAATGLVWIQGRFFADTFAGTSAAAGPDPILLVVGSAVWWLGTAVVIGLVGLAEARAGDGTADPAALRRAAVCRFWAGLVAVIGLATAVSQSGALPTGEYGRIVEPWIAILAMLILSGILLERAFRRDATSFIYAAALGLIVALTDLNVSYLSAGTEIALFLEGVILLAVGFAANALRRRVGRPDDEPPAGPVPSLVIPGDSPTAPAAAAAPPPDATVDFGA